MRTHLLTFTLSAAVIVLPGYAQDVDAGNDSLPTTPTATADSTPVAPATQPTVQLLDEEPESDVGLVVIEEGVTASSMERGRDTLSVDFPDEEIRNILRNVADLFELNLVIPDTLQGNTSIKLRDVTWRQIFEVVLGPAGYTFVEEGNIIKVVSQNSLLQEPTTTDVFVINYARADDLRSSIEPLIDSGAGGRIVVNARSNALVITERPSRLSRIRPIIEQLDKATDQVMIESKFVEVTNQDGKDLGVNWSSLKEFQVGVSETTRQFDSSRGNVIENGNTNERARTNTTTNDNQRESIDLSSNSRGSQSSNSSGVTSTGGVATAQGNSQVSSNLGSENSFSDTLTNTVSGVDEIADTATSLNSLLASGGTTRVTSALFSASQFGLVLSALQSKNDTKLVSNPTVVTLNNTEALISVGKEFPIPNYTYNAERGTFEVSGFEYRPVGIILRVTPQVNAQGFIKLSIEPEVSSSNESTSFGGAGGAQIPIISTRKAVTQISLRDGYTMGIGGLIETTARNGQTKVPLLGSIPGLGRLFRSDSKLEDRRNLLIFITAKTVAADGAPIGEIFDPRAVRDMGLREDELPGFRDGSDPFAGSTSSKQ